MPSSGVGLDNAASLSRAEQERVAALKRYDILDSEPEAAFDELTRLAASICEAPIAAINFIADGRQWFKSQVALTGAPPLDFSICKVAIQHPGLLVVSDLSRDERFCGNPIVTSAPGFRFYAGAVLLTPGGYALGTLCVLDYKPRELSDFQKDALMILGRQVMVLLELRRRYHDTRSLADSEFKALQKLRETQFALNLREEQLQLITDLAPTLIAYIDKNERYLLINKAYEDWYRRARSEIIGMTMRELLGEKVYEAVASSVAEALAGRRARFETEVSYQDGSRWIAAEYTPDIDSFGNVHGFVAFADDVSARKRASEVLKASESRKAAILNSSLDAILSIDEDGRIVEFNPAAERVFGYTHEQVIGQSMAELLVPERLRNAHYRGLERYRQTGEGKVINTRIELPALRADGSEFPMEIAIVPVPDTTPPLFTGFLRDLTRRKALESSARESEERLRLIADNMPALIGYLDSEQRFRFNNSAYREWFGIEPEALKGKHLRDLVGEEIYEQRKPYLERALNGESVRFDGPLKHQRLGLREAELAYIGDVDAGGRVRGVFVMALDVTDRKSAERALRASERSLQLVADNVPAMISYIDRHGHYRFTNAAYHEWFGIALDELVGREVREVLGEETFSQRIPYIERVLKGETVRFEAPTRHCKFGVRDTDVSYVPDFAEDGLVRGFYVMVFDVTERKRAEAALIEADRRKDQFLAMLAHELRNPLAPLSNAVSIWPMVENDRAKMEELREIMGRQLKQMTRLIDDLLDVSRISRGKIDLRRQKCDLGIVLNSAVEAVKPFIERQRQQLNVVLPEEQLTIDGDATRLVQVFGNLLHNSAKYAPSRTGVIWLTAEREGRLAVIRLRDNGPGIPSEMLSKIFDMFVQVDQTLERSHGGLGIGLTLARILLELHGGSVEARSEGLGRGAEFIVRLPVAAVESEQPPVVAKYGLRTIVPSQKRRVLIVDDLEASANTLAMVLESIGHEALAVYSGDSALEVVHEFAPDAVFLDIAMPGMNGYQVAKRLRAMVNGVTLVALTGFGHEEDQRQSREAGFDHHLVKPASIEAIEKVLERIQ
jgi:PAS domain S-box-containing protein